MAVTDSTHWSDRAGEKALRALERKLRRLARSITPAIWWLGDGNGGWVVEELLTAAAEAGLQLPERHVGYGRPLVWRLAERDGWECRYCGALLGWGHPSVTTPEVDHVMPRSRGGTNELANLVLACVPCNSAKGAKAPEEWLGK